MTDATLARPESAFISRNTPLFFDRFSLSYFKEGACIEYFINKHSSGETISSALIFSYNPHQRDLHVSRFYPELHLLNGSKYLSATCFYLLIHHCAESYSLDNTCHISLETVQKVSNRFYKRLDDFNFHVTRRGLGKDIELVSRITRSTVDTSMIQVHILRPGEIPFMK